MKPETIKAILDRYFDGKSSLLEEQQLRDYFNQKEISADLKSYQPLFQVLKTEQEVRLPADFEASFMELLEQQAPEVPVRTIRRPLRTWIGRAAAILILVFGLAWILRPPVENTETAGIDWSQYEPEDPEEAIEYYKAAMLKLGSALNNGASKAGHNIKHVEEVGQFFQ